MQPRDVFGWLVIRAFDVESIQCDASFGIDASERDIEAVVVDCLGQTIEQADLIVSLNLDDGSLHGKFVIHLDRRRKRIVQSVIIDRPVATAGILFSLGKNWK